MHSNVSSFRVASAAADAGFCTRCGFLHHGVESGLMAAKCCNCHGHHVWHKLPLLDMLRRHDSYIWGRALSVHMSSPERALRLPLWGSPDSIPVG